MDDNKLDYITRKLDVVADKVADIDTKLEVHIAKFDIAAEKAAEDRMNIGRNTDVLHANTASLQDHMKRTELLEDYVKKIDERFTPVELEALKKKAVGEWWKLRILFLAKLGGALGAIGALGAAAKMLIHYLW